MHAQHTPVFSFARRLALGTMLAATLTACGYKGPLYMPPPPPPEATLTTPPPPSQPLTDTDTGEDTPTTTPVSPVE